MTPSTFLLVKDPAFPATPPWWMLLLARNDHDTLLRYHRLFTRHFWMQDGRDPHNQRDRDRAAREDTFSIADLRHPTVLSGKWMTTALSIFTSGDVLIGSKGGMRPRDGTLIELETHTADRWPPEFDPKRRITIMTWGTHHYLVCGDMAFEGKHNTEAEAMEVALRYAPADRITVKREARSFREGD